MTPEQAKEIGSILERMFNNFVELYKRQEDRIAALEMDNRTMRAQIEALQKKVFFTAVDGSDPCLHCEDHDHPPADCPIGKKPAEPVIPLSRRENGKHKNRCPECGSLNTYTAKDGLIACYKCGKRGG